MLEGFIFEPRHESKNYHGVDIRVHNGTHRFHASPHRDHKNMRLIPAGTRLRDCDWYEGYIPLSKAEQDALPKGLSASATIAINHSHQRSYNLLSLSVEGSRLQSGNLARIYMVLCHEIAEDQLVMYGLELDRVLETQSPYPGRLVCTRIGAFRGIWTNTDGSHKSMFGDSVWDGAKDSLAWVQGGRVEQVIII